MKPSFRNLGAIGGLLAVMVLTISACDQAAKKKPQSPPIKIAQQKPEPKRKVPVEQEPPPEPAPKRQAAVPVPAPVVPDEPVAKSPDKASSKAVELGRASITQADEPAIRTPDLRGWDPLA